MYDKLNPGGKIMPKMITMFRVEGKLENQVVELIKENRSGKTEEEMAVELDIPVSEVNSAVASLVDQEILSEKGRNWANKPIYGLHPFM